MALTFEEANTVRFMRLQDRETERRFRRRMREFREMMRRLDAARSRRKGQ